MPIPNIDLSQVTGLRKNSVELPRISTRIGLIDGKRPPLPSQVDWPSRLARVRSASIDPKFDPKTDIQYVGSFRVPHWSDAGGNARQKIAMCYNPPEADGRNGPNGSVFFGGVQSIAEVQIPTIKVEEDHWDLNAGTILQSWVRMYERAPVKPPEGESDTEWCGWLKIIDGKLYSGWHGYYTFDANETNLLIIEDPSDLANSPLQGLLNVEGRDKIARYIGDVPPEHQAAFGGKYFNGVCADLNIISRSSFGHSVLAWNPQDIQATDTVIPTNELLFYPQGGSVEGFSGTIGPVKDHYSDIVGMPIQDYIQQVDPADRETTFDNWPVPDDADTRPNEVSYMTKCGCAFIPPGSDTICFLGGNSGMRFGIGYKTQTIEGGQGTGGWGKLANYDQDPVFWTLNINDVLNATSAADVQYSEFGIFPHSPYEFYSSNGNLNTTRMISGDFDPSTGLLYLFHQGAPENQFESQYIIAVYQVGGGQ